VLVNADRSVRAVVHTRREPWGPSPAPGVERIVLERIGDEIALATSLVRFAPNASFAPHAHDRGEEILVLEGELMDEHGVYPAGTYLRNPWGTRHTPRSRVGCTLFVKLRQLAKDDLARVCVLGATGRCRLGPDESERELVLHEHGDERVALVRWRAGGSAPPNALLGGEELFVIEGDLDGPHGRHEAGTWIRQPRGSREPLRTGGGCLLFVKSSPA
jgi:anti-sigma factor ChrR (cupin superfamily)